MQEGSQAMFYCDQEIPWGSLATEGGVKLATSNRCHLFCDMVTTLMHHLSTKEEFYSCCRI